MLHFDSDYMEGAHPAILQKLLETNLEQTPGYGTDEYCEQARRKIRQACGSRDAGVFFMVGGTQTNATVIDAFLRSYEGVVAAKSGHINVHEAGAIEAGGHKVIELEAETGKLSAETVGAYLKSYEGDDSREHMTAPGLVYISHPTEYGTLYTKKELTRLSEVCAEHKIPLYLDGARLGYGLMSDDTDVTLADITELCDAFYIGGTKVGAMFGEAVVVTRHDRFGHFFTIMKQHGSVLAKGRLLGIQFDTLFTDGLYLKIARHADELAMKLARAFVQKGYRMYLDSPTNQQFVVLENVQLEKLSQAVTFSIWEKIDVSHTVVRFATSWATREEDVDALIALL